MIFAIIMIIIEIIIISVSAYRHKFAPYPHGVFLVIIGSQFALMSVYSGFTDYLMLYTYSNRAFMDNFVEINLYLFSYYIIIALSVIGVQGVGFRGRVTDVIRTQILQLLDNKTGKQATNFVIVGLYLHLAFLFMNFDWAYVWENDVYTGMTSNFVLSSRNFLSIFALQLNQLLCMVAVVIFSYEIATKSYLQLIIVSPLVAFQFLYHLSAHSRVAVLLIIIFALLNYIFNRSLFKLAIAIFVAFIVQNYVLMARNDLLHGFSTLGDMPDVMISASFDDYMSSIINVFEGIFVSSEYPYYNHEHPSIYKILSFSPFPSFIDGFSGILDAGIARLNWFVPPSAVLELYSFGFYYALFYFSFQFVAGRLAFEFLVKRGTFMALLCNFIIFFACYLQFAYPVRNVFRFLVVGFVVTLFAYKLLGASNTDEEDKRPGEQGEQGRKPGSSALKKSAKDSHLSPAVLRRRRKLAEEMVMKSNRDN